MHQTLKLYSDEVAFLSLIFSLGAFMNSIVVLLAFAPDAGIVKSLILFLPTALLTIFSTLFIFRTLKGGFLNNGGFLCKEYKLVNEFLLKNGSYSLTKRISRKLKPLKAGLSSYTLVGQATGDLDKKSVKIKNRLGIIGKCEQFESGRYEIEIILNSPTKKGELMEIEIELTLNNYRIPKKERMGLTCSHETESFFFKIIAPFISESSDILYLAKNGDSQLSIELNERSIKKQELVWSKSKNINKNDEYTVEIVINEDTIQNSTDDDLSEPSSVPQ